jgi:hypothetical protein
VNPYGGSIWSDKRLWAAAALALVFRACLAGVLDGDPRPPDTAALENPALAPTRPQDEATGPMRDVERVLREQQIKKINLHDGSSAEPLTTPEAAAAWIGGLVLFLGGFGAVWLWRRAERSPADPDPRGQFPTT